ncbi:zinc finger protein 782-like [Uranotaenia lowii]|uniref:zinc finger protein 782-like n=1 Tax=Uranotaenia lowii TaxID=190385 RepID=UPI00247909DB|nr:zinc finger protein 782-like [Uranotaenia lowii]
MSDVNELLKTCRFCLQDCSGGKKSVPINNLEQTIYELLDIKLSDHDHQSELMCLSCHEIICCFEEFNRTIKSNQISQLTAIANLNYINGENRTISPVDRCRLCTNNYGKNNKMYSIKEVEDKLNAIFDLKSCDELSQQVCHVCYESIGYLYTFKEMVLENAAYLDKALDEEEKTELLNGHSNGNRVEDTREQVLPCPYCGGSFSQKKDLLQHHAQHHPKNKLFECEHCDKTFLDERTLQCHESACWLQKTNTKRGTFQCDDCKETLPSFTLLTYHKRFKHMSEKFTCQDCNRVFLMKLQYNWHRTPRRYKCETCEEPFKLVCLLHRHKALIHGFTVGYQKIVSPEDPDLSLFKCDLCDGFCEDHNIMITHKQSCFPPRSDSATESIPKKILYCRKCKLKFAHPRSLKKHKCRFLKKAVISYPSESDKSAD